MVYSEIAMLSTFLTLTLLLIMLFSILLSVLSGWRLRSVSALVMAAAVVWLYGCSGQSSDTQSTAKSEGPLYTQSVSTYLQEGINLDALGFDAGKADAFLLTTEHSAVLIDAGEKGFGKTILTELETRGIKRLDYMIITHFDQDHVGGAAKVINNFPVEIVLQSNSPKDSEEYEKFVKALSSASIEPITVREAMEFTLDGVSFYVDPPKKTNYLNDDSNNSSLIVTVKTGYGSILFLGDAQTERLDEFLSWNTETYDVIKIPHHGKEESLISDVLSEVQPQFAVITSSWD